MRIDSLDLLLVLEFSKYRVNRGNVFSSFFCARCTYWCRFTLDILVAAAEPGISIGACWSTSEYEIQIRCWATAQCWKYIFGCWCESRIQTCWDNMLRGYQQMCRKLILFSQFISARYISFGDYLVNFEWAYSFWLVT